jgi:hypothetical protein
LCLPPANEGPSPLIWWSQEYRGRLVWTVIPITETRRPLFFRGMMAQFRTCTAVQEPVSTEGEEERTIWASLPSLTRP